MTAAPTREDIARRTRAAIAYANLKGDGTAARLNTTPATLSRIVSPTNPRGASREELEAIADGCGVPREFMLSGFALLEGQTSEIDARVAALEDQVAHLHKNLPTAEQIEGLVVSRLSAALAEQSEPQQDTRRDSSGQAS